MAYLQRGPGDAGANEAPEPQQVLEAPVGSAVWTHATTNTRQRYVYCEKNRHRWCRGSPRIRKHIPPVAIALADISTVPVIPSIPAIARLHMRQAVHDDIRYVLQIARDLRLLEEQAGHDHSESIDPLQAQAHAHVMLSKFTESVANICKFNICNCFSFTFSLSISHL